ncbi:MAG: CHAT domain-containing protein [Muribaculaceae bacterium]|nr:CHAT domain-containing protein [Muribaculaceae bacterium]
MMKIKILLSIFCLLPLSAIAIDGNSLASTTVENDKRKSLSALVHDIVESFDDDDYSATIKHCQELKCFLMMMNKTTSLDYMMAEYYEGRSQYESLNFVKAAVCLANCDELAQAHNLNNDNNDHISYSALLNYIARSYMRLHDSSNAFAALERLKKFVVENYGTKSTEYAMILNDLAACYTEFNEDNKAVELYRQSLEIMEELQQTDGLDYAILLGNIASCEARLGNFEQSEAFCRKAVSFFETHKGTSIDDDYFKVHYATAMSDLAGCIVETKQYEEAVELSGAALDIHGYYYGKSHPEYVISLNNHAYCLYRAGKIGEAYNYYKDYLHVLDENAQMRIGCNVLHNLSLCCGDLGKYDEAIDYSLKALEIARKCYGDNLGIYATVLGNLSVNYFNVGNYERMYECSSEYISSMHKYLLREFPSMTSAGRAQLWERYSEGFQSMLPGVVVKHPTKEAVAELYDKGALFGKGLLLATDMELRDLLLNSEDSNVIDKLDALRATRSHLNELYALPIDERDEDTEALEQVAERQERELIKLSKTYGDIMHNLKIGWHDVRQCMGERDIAVEFLSFPELGDDVTNYIALTVRKGYDSPHLVRLFDEGDLEAVETSFYNEKELSGLVWGSLADELTGVENIYFSPSGELYNIAIESMPHWADDCMMSDKFNLYRLSSTRELAIARDETPSVGASVYGDIKYDTDVALMGIPRSETGSLHAFRGMNPASCATLRNKYWEELKGTKEEADTIADILSKSKVQVRELTGAGATETTVKNLSGQKRRILHIATHGFYWDEADAEYYRERDRLSFLLLGDTHARQVEDRVLTRSGLLFAGVQNTFYGKKIPAGVDDGVLTAQEIAQLDLRGLDLLVLSACQTGLGDVKGDGVFGLQRGFKKAGAHTILMSLREVEDKATRDMMIQFYKAYTAGCSKRDAFLAAQQYLKDHDADYGYDSSFERADHPHWASFILLDPM